MIFTTMNRVLFILISFVIALSVAASPSSSTKKERNYIREGNGYYKEKRYSDAETAYRKAIEVNQQSEIAAYNLASSLIRQSGTSDPNSGNNPMQEASSLLKGLTQAANSHVAELSYYNLGNMAFNQQQYQESIDMYKGALRLNPDNDKARQNLRLAQLKLQQQQKNNDQQDQDKNKDQNKDQNKNQQQKQDQQKDKQNKDQQDNQNSDQNKEKRNPNQEQRQQRGSISDENAAQILKTMENEENATRKRVNEMKKQEEKAAAGRRTGNQW